MLRSMTAPVPGPGLQIVREEVLSDELVAALAALVPQLSSSSPPPGRAEVEQLLASDATVLFTARAEGGRIVGTLTLVLFHIPTGIRAHIEDVVVDEEARGYGAGSLLVREAIAAAAAAGAQNVDLTSRPTREAANRLYERVGFIRRETNVYRMNLA
jgi:ribosomal protein S18 acetylase RimI-like enzyme